jgi:hypothetical protein
MEETVGRGISRQGLDEEFAHDEALKSRLFLEAGLLREQHAVEAAIGKFAEAAEIEERLSASCERVGLAEKALVHRFSAAGAWAQAGNFYRALVLCDELLSRRDLTNRLRERVTRYAEAIRARRAQWQEDLSLTVVGSEEYDAAT